ncbi:MAG TPA: cytochrome c oxidase subunit II [Gammaproteobacteria bacterium]|jgi:cytochrome c oxidase subunit 2|nr:cytochrome c oxidase subunit II [Gammaproteobacteria bacterium]
MKSISRITGKFFYTLLFLVPTSVFSEASDYNMRVGVTEVSKEIFDLHMLIMWICVWIGVVVFGIMFWSLWKYRKSSGAIAAKFDDHFWVEIAWTIAATVILVGMAIPSTSVMIKAYDDTEGDVNIMVTGYQWKWQYKYLEDGVSFFSNLATSQEEINNALPKGEFYLSEVDEPLVIPINKRIRFLITGNDVIHSWWVPDFAVKQDAVPGFINTAWTIVPKPGIYRGACTELCGLGHAFMPIVVRAVEQEEYEAWIIEKIVLAETEKLLTEKVWTKAELIERGQGVYLKNCVACHQANGQGLPPVFPSLEGSQIVMRDKARNIEILMEGVQGAAMQDFSKQLSEVDIASVITYTRDSWSNGKNGDGEIVVPKDIVDYKNRAKL